MMGSTVVTGAGKGIGKAITRSLAAAGIGVVAVDWDEEALLAAVQGLDAVTPVVGDVGDWDTHERAAADALALGPLTGWVNNAGIDVVGGAHEVTAQDIDTGLRVLQLGTMYGSAVAVRRMLPARTGAIVNIASIQGMVAFPRYFVYQAAKAAVIMLSKGIAVDYGPAGIRCNVVCPGAIHTTLGRAGVSEHDLTDDDIRTDFAPLGRIGEPEEISDVVCFLLSEGASYVNGSVVVADGGSTARCYAFEVSDDIATSVAAGEDDD